MNLNNAIEVNDIEKSFKIYLDKSSNIKEKFITKGRNRFVDRKVLKGISFEIRKGEAVGLIGRNGCGKSTTLKLLTKIIYPDKGKIDIKGRVSSLLELGAGFHPDMSGRENIYLNAAVFGLTKKEISLRIDEIIKFSELGDSIENPVRTYSSGMYMRLAFSVAINVNADILLIDEILGVGDVSFQKKCFERLLEIRDRGVTIVIVSHSLEQIERICDRVIWIEEGTIKNEGKPRDINALYYKLMEDERLQRCEKDFIEYKEKRINEEQKTILSNKNNAVKEEQETKGAEKNKKNEKIDILPAFCDKMAVRTGNRAVEFQDITLLNSKDQESIIYHSNDLIKIKFKVFTTLKNVNASVSISIWREDGILCYGLNTYTENEVMINLDEKDFFSLILDNVKLMSGKYYMNVGLYNKELKEYDSIKKVKSFYIQSDLDNKEFGLYQMEHRWVM